MTRVVGQLKLTIDSSTISEHKKDVQSLFFFPVLLSSILLRSTLSEQKFIQALFSFPSLLSSTTLLPAPATADRTPAKGVGAEPKRHLAGGCGGEGTLERGRGGRGAGAPAAAYEEVRGLALVVREAASRTGTSKERVDATATSSSPA